MSCRFAIRFCLMAAVLQIFCHPAFAGAPEIEMVYVRGGCFQMGDTFGDGGNDEKPVHEVCVSDFYLGKYEVTQEQWMDVMGHNPSRFEGDRQPVEQVSWNEVQQFIAKLNAMTGKRYRLPTEAEWEYAARSGGRKEKWAGTSNENMLGDYAWYSKNSDERTHVVGTKKPNGLGIYDMTGNVWEWCQDVYGDEYYEESPRDNPKGSKSGSYRVNRGGSWGNDSEDVRAAIRYDLNAVYRSSGVGFRLSRTP
jgi:formylglycine-generating enzyme required for sulfatase activity